MGSYKVVLKPTIEKDLRSISRKMLARVFERLEALETEPIPRQSAKLEGSDELYRVVWAIIVFSMRWIARGNKLLYITSAIVGKSIADCKNHPFKIFGEKYG